MQNTAMCNGMCQAILRLQMQKQLSNYLWFMGPTNRRSEKTHRAFPGVFFLLAFKIMLNPQKSSTESQSSGKFKEKRSAFSRKASKDFIITVILSFSRIIIAKGHKEVTEPTKCNTIIFLKMAETVYTVQIKCKNKKKKVNLRRSSPWVPIANKINNDIRWKCSIIEI